MSRRLARAGSAAFAALVAITGALFITIPAQAAVTGATSTTTTTVTGGTTTLAGMSVTALASDSVSVSVSTTVGTLTVNTGTGITLAYGYAATGSVIAFTGNGTQVNAALGSIQLTVPGSAKGSSATVAIVAQEGTSSVVYSADTGHYYEYVANSGISWSAARAAAQLRTFSGQSGYLATVPSAAVNALITSKIPGALNVWLGGRAIANVGGYARSWQWMNGPLAGTEFSRCSTAIGSCDFVNSVGFYRNWAPNEPNNWQGTEESIVTNWNSASGLWNDLADSGSATSGYVVEYGNLVYGSTPAFTGTFSASSSVAIVGVPNPPTGVSATSGLGQATMSFAAPANSGGAAIDTYLITVSPGGATFSCAASPCTVIGLTGGDSYTFGVQAHNTYGYSTTASSSAITIGLGPASPTGMAATAVVGLAYSDSVSAAGYPAPTYSVTGGALPDGLSLNGTSGAITGNPTTAGAWSVTITATNTYSSAAATFTGTTGEAPIINTTTLGTLMFGVPVDFYLSVDGTPAPTVAVTSGALPSGLTLDANGRVHGTPNASGAYTLSVLATNTYGTYSQAYSGTVDMAPASPTGMTTTAVVGQAYSDSVSAAGYPAPTYSVTGGALPDGLSLDGTTGAITGTPTTAGAWSVTVTATNAYGTAATTFTGTTGQAPTINTTTLGTLTWGTAVDFYLSIDGTPAPTATVTSGALPSGLTLDADGRVRGTPDAVGAYTLSVDATNTYGTDTQAYSGTVAMALPSAPTITGISGSNGALSVEFTAPASSGGGTILTYLYSIDGGATWLPRATGTDESPLVITGLTNGTTYSVMVLAVNDAGSGTFSSVVLGTAGALAATGFSIIPVRAALALMISGGLLIILARRRERAWI